MQTESTTLQKLGSVAVGTGGISLSFFDVANYAQATGMIFGCLIVLIQFGRIVSGMFKGWKRKRGSAANDR